MASSGTPCRIYLSPDQFFIEKINQQQGHLSMLAVEKRAHLHRLLWNNLSASVNKYCKICMTLSDQANGKEDWPCRI